jgi:hypothetical protein
MDEGHPIAVGTRVEKINSDEADLHQDGAGACVVEVWGPLAEPVHTPSGSTRWGYLVEWDDLPRVSAFVAGHRIRRAVNTVN